MPPPGKLPPKGPPPKAIAPGSVPRAPLSKIPPALHPQPKPIGPSKGGPPPHPLFPRKPPPGKPQPQQSFVKGSSARALIGIGDKEGGHATSKHLTIPDKDLAPRFAEKHVKSDTVSKFATLHDQRRAAAAVRNSPEFRQAKMQLRNAPTGTAASIRIGIQDGAAPRVRAVTRSNPDKVVAKAAPTLFAKVAKTPRGLGAKTLVGEPAPPAGAKPRPMGVKIIPVKPAKPPPRPSK
jgi:hypothetical protein